MRKFLTILLALILSVGLSFGRGGSVSVRGYFRSNGTYVAPHFRSAPDGYFWNNYSAKGNVNPFTGTVGTKLPPVNYGSDVWVNGYFRKDGTYVHGYYRSAPNGNTLDIFSTSGSINPSTGKVGTKLPPLKTDNPSSLPEYSGSSDNTSTIANPPLPGIGFRMPDTFSNRPSPVFDRPVTVTPLLPQELQTVQQTQPIQPTHPVPSMITSYTYSESKMRNQKAAEIKRQLDRDLDPEKYTYSQMLDIQMRYQKAAEVKRQRKRPIIPTFLFVR